LLLRRLLLLLLLLLVRILLLKLCGAWWWQDTQLAVTVLGVLTVTGEATDLHYNTQHAVQLSGQLQTRDTPGPIVHNACTHSPWHIWVARHLPPKVVLQAN
jgi:hypothetical protein